MRGFPSRRIQSAHLRATGVRGLARSGPRVKRRQAFPAVVRGGEVPFLQRWRKNLFFGKERVRAEWR
jgi:hypothetical protein